MRQSRSIGNEPNFSKIILISVILHLLFISIVAVPLRTKEGYMTYHVTLVGPLHTPRTGKPALIQEKAKRVASKKKAVKAPPPEADMSIEEVAKEIERIRAISALSKKREDGREKTREIRVGKEKTAGKRLKDTGVHEGAAGGDRKGMDLYYDLISREIWQHWSYPDVRTSGLEVVISIRIDKTGRVISQEIEKFSGDILFDRSAIKAISKASPFPPPPEEVEIGVRFYL